MIRQAVTDLGPWAWMIVGFALLAIEVVAPGVWFMWFGFAAITVGSILLLPFADAAGWSWQAQALAFALLSAIYVFIGRRLLPNRGEDADRFNRPLDRFVGREAVLVEPISGGFGRVRLGDTMWRVAGPDLPQGTKVRVSGHDGERLTVEPAA